MVVIFGASGDLTKRKLLPALFHLEQAGCCRRSLPWWAWRGGRWSDSFAADMREGIMEGGGVKDGDPKLDAFMRKVSYHAMNFDDHAGYDGAEEVAGEDGRQSTSTKGNRLFYLASAPEYFSDIMN